MEPVIETGVPIPPSEAGRRKGNARPRIMASLESLRIGDNLLWPERDYHARNRVAEAASRVSARTRQHFTIRLMDDGVRCWRIA